MRGEVEGRVRGTRAAVNYDSEGTLMVAIVANFYLNTNPCLGEVIYRIRC